MHSESPRAGPERSPSFVAPRPLLPSVCAVCNGFGHARICARCDAAFGVPRPRCSRCAIGVPAGVAVCGGCLASPPPQRHAVAVFDYAAPWDRVIARLKFAGEPDLAAPLADRLAAAIAGAAAASGWPLPERVVPAPLAPARLAERGYNQAWELARRVARRLHIPAEAAMLVRIRETPHQLALPLAERAANVRAAFVLEPARRATVRGRSVAVVDDVLTSGATAAELARTLLHAGAAAVDVWVVARTPSPGGA